jgi:hypothetical protein
MQDLHLRRPQIRKRISDHFDARGDILTLMNDFRGGAHAPPDFFGPQARHIGAELR